MSLKFANFRIAHGKRFRIYIWGKKTNQIITKETQMVCGLGSRKKATYFALKLLTDMIVSQPNLHKNSVRNQFTPLVLT